MLDASVIPDFGGETEFKDMCLENDHLLDWRLEQRKGENTVHSSLHSWFMFDLDHPEAGLHRYCDLLFRFEGVHDRARQAASLLGHNTRELLQRRAGLAIDEIDALVRSGVALQAGEPIANNLV
jgi:hypothetical protein